MIRWLVCDNCGFEWNLKDGVISSQCSECNYCNMNIHNDSDGEKPKRLKVELNDSI